MKSTFASLILLAALGLYTHPAKAQRSPDELLNLARAGAPMLALSIMDQRQPDQIEAPYAWVGWERVRLDILWEAGRYRDIVKRVERLDEGLPEDFLGWARVHRARAHLKLGEGAPARDLLRAQIWAHEPGKGGAAFSAWRRLVIESYLVDGLLEDAQAALLRYELDYREQTQEERYLRARLLIRIDQPKRVAEVLKGENSAQAQALKLYAQLLARHTSAEAIRLEARKLAWAKDTASDDRARLWYVASQAAARGGDPVRQVAYLEKALVSRRFLGEDDKVFSFDGETLWAAYRALGQQQGNRARLLIGDDAAWLAAAQKLLEKSPQQARAFLAVVAHEGAQEAARDTAHQRLSASLAAEEGGSEVIDALYLRAERFAAIDTIPLPVRHVLANHALGRGEVPLASRLMAGMSQAPQGVDPFLWQLRRSRVHILGGHEDEGIDILYSVLAQHKTLDKAQADRFMQVLFDLQTVQRHKAAIGLFVALEPRLVEAQHRREILFWQADSYKALGQYEQAAWFYMRSAILLDPYALDPWAQTCRFHAAGTLAEAGLTQDARALYEQLLGVTQNEQRRQVLSQKLQQLRLSE